MRGVLWRVAQRAMPLLGQSERNVWVSGGRRLMRSCIALVYRKHSALCDSVRMERLPLPAVGERGVRVRMLAAPVNPADLNMIQGTYPLLCPLPAVGGNEGVGEVVEVGPAVTSLRSGDWVVPTHAGFGTWRTEVVCDVSELMQVPSDISLLSAATIWVNPCTAYRMLHDFVPPQEGSTVIQNGANGAVGRAVIQISAALGLRTINIIRDRPDREAVEQELRSLGADHVITETHLQGAGLEQLFQEVSRPKLGLNCVGGQSGALLLSQLDDEGTLVTYGGMARKPLQIPAKSLIFKNITFRGFWMTQWKWNHRNDVAGLSSMLGCVCELVRCGQLSPPTCVQLPLQEYHRALQTTLQGRRHKHILLM